MTLLPEIPNEDIVYAQAELSRLDAYEKIYSRTHALPVKKVLDFTRSLGIEALVAALSSIGALVLAAIRTGTIFLQAERTLLEAFNTTGILFQALPLISMIAALFAVEGYLFAQGLKKGRSKVAHNAMWGMIFAMGISVVAGIASSSGLIGNFSGTPKTVLDVSLAIMTGIGATVLAYYGGENLGTIFVRWDRMQTDAEEDYQGSLSAWKTKMQTEYRSRGRSAVFGLDKYTTKNTEKETEDIVDPGVVDKVQEWLAENGLTAFDVGGDRNTYSITPADIAKHLHIRKSSVVRTVLSRMRKTENKSFTMEAKTLVPSPDGTYAELKLSDVVKPIEPIVGLSIVEEQEPVVEKTTSEPVYIPVDQT